MRAPSVSASCTLHGEHPQPFVCCCCPSYVFLSFFLLVVRLIFLLVERPQVQIPALRPYVPSRDLWVVRSRTLSAWRAFCLVSVMPAGRNISLLRSRTEM